MAKVVFLAMVGGRDVQVLDPEKLNQLGLSLNYREQFPTGWILNSPRGDGRKLWDAYKKDKTIADLIDLPILRTCLNYICNLDLTDELSVFLFYTNQSPRMVSHQHRSNDTLYFARIAEKWLPNYFRRYGVHINVKRIVISRCYIPVNQGEMLRFFDEKLPKLCPPNSVDWVFTSQTGGIPAVYESLFLQAVRYYRDKCVPMYVLPEGIVFPVEFREFLLEAFYREQVRGLLERYDYSSAANYLEQLNLLVAAALCRHAAYRLLFDFKRANEVLEEIAAKVSLNLSLLDKNRLVTPFQEEMKILQRDLPKPRGINDSVNWKQRKEQIRACLRELYWGLEIAVKREAWLEVLGRLIRLAEGIFQLAIEETFNQPAGTIDEILSLVENISPGLHKRLLRLPTKTNLNLLREITRQLKNQYPKWLEPAEKFAEAIRLDYGLIQMRNKSILWHGFRGISKEELEGALEKAVQNVLEDCQSVLKQLDVPLGEGPYELVRRYALKALDQP